MRETKWERLPALLLAVGTLSTSQIPARADGGLTARNFQQLYQQIRPQPGESRWLEVPWQIDLHAARQKAAAEGKPLFVMSGGGATAIGPC